MTSLSPQSLDSCVQFAQHSAAERARRSRLLDRFVGAGVTATLALLGSACAQFEPPPVRPPAAADEVAAPEKAAPDEGLADAIQQSAKERQRAVSSLRETAAMAAIAMGEPLTFPRPFGVGEPIGRVCLPRETSRTRIQPDDLYQGRVEHRDLDWQTEWYGSQPPWALVAEESDDEVRAYVNLQRDAIWLLLWFERSGLQPIIKERTVMAWRDPDDVFWGEEIAADVVLAPGAVAVIDDLVAYDDGAPVVSVTMTAQSIDLKGLVDRDAFADVISPAEFVEKDGNWMFSGSDQVTDLYEAPDGNRIGGLGWSRMHKNPTKIQSDGGFSEILFVDTDVVIQAWVYSSELEPLSGGGGFGIGGFGTSGGSHRVTVPASSWLRVSPSEESEAVGFTVEEVGIYQLEARSDGWHQVGVDSPWGTLPVWVFIP